MTRGHNPIPVAILALALMSAQGRPQEADPLLHSPDGRLAIGFQVVPSKPSEPGVGQLVYSVTLQGMSLLSRSALRLMLQDQPPLGSAVRIVNSSLSIADEIYELATGKTRIVRDHHYALRLELEEPQGLKRKLTIEARAYNDAIAFRYLVPQQPALHDFRLVNEATEFRLSKDATAYALVLPRCGASYESEFLKLPVSALPRQTSRQSTSVVGLPLLMEIPGLAWIAVTEANLRDYSGLCLVNPSADWAEYCLESRLAPQPGESRLCVSGPLPHYSPWRVVMVNTEPARMTESNVLTSLNPESALEDTSWIQAGKAAWNGWSRGAGPSANTNSTTSDLKSCIDFAARSGLQYVLIDSGWAQAKDITLMNGLVDIRELVRYAAAAGIRLWIGIPFEQADTQMGAAFPLYEAWGVAGVRIDLTDREDQQAVQFLHRAAAQAGEHHLMVDFQGGAKPTGLERTYPNVLAYDAVLGMEHSRAGSRDNPEHRVTVPFTRMLAGPMNYMLGGFDNVRREDFEPSLENPPTMGTRAQQLAMYVVYLAPFQMVCDNSGAYENSPEFDFIRRVPATWDATRAAGTPGEQITIARRHGSEWFLGSMTNWRARQLDIPLDFLGPGRYVAQIYADAPDADRYPKGVRVEERRVNRRTHLRAQLAPGGGYAVRFVPVAP